MMRTDPRTAATVDPAACLATAAALLARASDLAWAQARSTPDPRLRFRGLGLDLAAAQALELLPADVSLGSIEDITGSDPLALLRAAEKVLRRCPVEDLPVGGAQLVVEVCDLMSELAP